MAWPIRSGVVPPPASCFNARPETAPDLSRALTPGATVVLAPPHSAPRAGATGRTQLAVSVAEGLWHQRAVDFLVWIDASSRASVLAGYQAAAAEVTGVDPADGAEEVAARFVTWLRGSPQPWLMILDDVQSAADLHGLWPSGAAGTVLVTCAATVEPADLPQAVVLPVGRMSRRESLSYLRDRLTGDPDQRLGAIDLVEDLAGDLAALVQASGVIASSTMSCHAYRDRFAERQRQLTDPSGPGPSPADVTWTLATEHADALSPRAFAQSLLPLCAVLDGHGVPAELLLTAAVRRYLAHGTATAEIAEEDVLAALLALQRVGLVSIEPTATPPAVYVPADLQAAVLAAMPPGMAGQAACVAADALAQMWPADEPEPWLAARLRASAECVWRAAGELLWADGCHPMLFRAGLSLDAAQLRGDALAHWTQLASLSTRILPAGHPDTLTIGEHLARASLAAGRADDAVSWFQWALAGRSQSSAADHGARVATTIGLVRALTAAGQQEEAVRLMTAAAADGASDDFDTIAARTELAAAYQAMGRFAEAVHLHRRVVADCEHVRGRRHRDTIFARRRLADACLAANRLKDALAEYRRALVDAERALGADHPDTIAIRLAFAGTAHAAGRMAFALQLYEQARADAERVLGVDHRDALASSVGLAAAYYKVGRLTDARTLLADSVERCERALPAGHPLTASARQTLANISQALPGQGRPGNGLSASPQRPVGSSFPAAQRRTVTSGRTWQ